MLGTSQAYRGRNRTATRLDHAIYDLNPEQNIFAGAFIVRRCSFERCLFHRIGFVTHADQREVFRTECVEEEAKE